VKEQKGRKICLSQVKMHKKEVILRQMRRLRQKIAPYAKNGSLSSEFFSNLLMPCNFYTFCHSE
jgi:ribosomal protein L19E